MGKEHRSDGPAPFPMSAAGLAQRLDCGGIRPELPAMAHQSKSVPSGLVARPRWGASLGMTTPDAVPFPVVVFRRL